MAWRGIHGTDGTDLRVASSTLHATDSKKGVLKNVSLYRDLQTVLSIDLFVFVQMSRVVVMHTLGRRGNDSGHNVSLCQRQSNDKRWATVKSA